MSLSAEIRTSIEAIGEKVWDRLAPNDNPFLSYRFLYELEASKSVGPQESGWLPHHIELKDGDDTCALIPLYISLILMESISSIGPGRAQRIRPAFSTIPNWLWQCLLLQ